MKIITLIIYIYIIFILLINLTLNFSISMIKYTFEIDKNTNFKFISEKTKYCITKYDLVELNIIKIKKSIPRLKNQPYEKISVSIDRQLSSNTKTLPVDTFNIIDYKYTRNHIHIRMNITNYEILLDKSLDTVLVFNYTMKNDYLKNVNDPSTHISSYYDIPVFNENYLSNEFKSNIQVDVILKNFFYLDPTNIDIETVNNFQFGVLDQLGHKILKFSNGKINSDNSIFNKKNFKAKLYLIKFSLKMFEPRRSKVGLWINKPNMKINSNKEFVSILPKNVYSSNIFDTLIPLILLFSMLIIIFTYWNKASNLLKDHRLILKFSVRK